MRAVGEGVVLQVGRHAVSDHVYADPDLLLLGVWEQLDPTMFGPPSGSPIYDAAGDPHALGRHALGHSRSI